MYQREKARAGDFVIFEHDVVRRLFKVIKQTRSDREQIITDAFSKEEWTGIPSLEEQDDWILCYNPLDIETETPDGDEEAIWVMYPDEVTKIEIEKDRALAMAKLLAKGHLEGEVRATKESKKSKQCNKRKKDGKPVQKVAREKRLASTQSSSNRVRKTTKR